MNQIPDISAYAIPTSASINHNPNHPFTCDVDVTLEVPARLFPVDEKPSLSSSEEIFCALLPPAGDALTARPIFPRRPENEIDIDYEFTCTFHVGDVQLEGQNPADWLEEQAFATYGPSAGSNPARYSIYRDGNSASKFLFRRIPCPAY